MGGMSIWHWLVVGVAVLLLFGGVGKIPRLMSDLAKGVTAFKKGLKETEDDVVKPADGTAPPAPQVTTDGTVATPTPEVKKEAKV